MELAIKERILADATQQGGTMKRLVIALSASVVTLTFTQPASALDPETWAAIAQAAWNVYSQTQEGTCVNIAARCDKKNINGAKNKCHEVYRRIGVFEKEPNDYNASQVYQITGSNRTVCMGQQIMGGDAWEQFNSHRN